MPPLPNNSLPKPDIAHALCLLALNPNSWALWHLRNLACPHAQCKTSFLLEAPHQGGCQRATGLLQPGKVPWGLLYLKPHRLFRDKENILRTFSGKWETSKMLVQVKNITSFRSSVSNCGCFSIAEKILMFPAPLRT